MSACKLINKLFQRIFPLVLLISVLFYSYAAAVSWDEPVLISDALTYSAITTADMDNDGQSEIIAGYRGKGIKILALDSASNTWVITENITNPQWGDVHSVASGDFNKDGKMDLTITTRWRGCWSLVNQGPGVWAQSHLDGTYGWQVEVEDFDNDGNLDILDVTDWGYLKIFYGDGNGGFVPGGAPECPHVYGAGSFAVKDVNSDGLPDLIGRSWEWNTPGTDQTYLRVYLNEGSRTWSQSVGPSQACEIRQYVDAGDLNGDGYIDFAGGVYNGTKWEQTIFWGGKDSSGNYTWNDLQVLGEYSAVTSCQLSDLDNDGFLDYIVIGDQSFNGIEVFYGRENGVFTEAVRLAQDYPIIIKMDSLKDLNSDGFLDMVFIMLAENKIGVINSHQETGEVYVSPFGDDVSGEGTVQAPFQTIQKGIERVKSIGKGKVNVARGVYYENIVMEDGVNLIGGYNEAFSERRSEFKTVINGSSAGRCIYAERINSSTIIDGFYITNGYYAAQSKNDGGAGMFVNRSGPEFSVYNCVFSSNTLENSGFKNLGGGAVYLHNSSPSMFNNVIVYNTVKGSAESKGGGMYIRSGNPEILNSTFYGNNALNGSGIYSFRASPEISNSILWQDEVSSEHSSPLITYSNLSVFQGSGNIDFDPLFVDPDGADDVPGTLDDDFRLSENSLSIDAGSNTLVPADTIDIDMDSNLIEAFPYDVSFRPRLNDAPYTSDTGSGKAPLVDMGAYEYRQSYFLIDPVSSPSTSKKPLITGTKSDFESVVLSIDGAEVAGIDYPSETSWQYQTDYELEYGTHTLEASAYDREYKTKTELTDFRIIPVEAPSIDPVKSPTNQQYMVITGTKPADTKVRFLLDEHVKPGVIYPDENTWLYAFSVPIPEGYHYMQAQAYDAFGNNSRKSGITGFEVDLTPPGISVESPEENLLTNAEEIEVKGSLSEEISDFSINGASVAVTERVFVSSVILTNEGENAVLLEAVDLAGNTSALTLNITTDWTPPEITVTEPPDNLFVSQPTIQLKGYVSEPCSKLTIESNPVELTDNNFVSPNYALFDFGDVVDAGTKVFDLVAKDLAGNRAYKALNIIRNNTMIEANAGNSSGLFWLKKNGTIFRSDRPIIIFIHGASAANGPGGMNDYWQSARFQGWNAGSYNWADDNTPWAVYNHKAQDLFMKIVDIIEKSGFNNSEIRLAGYSWGEHLAAYTGKKLVRYIKNNNLKILVSVDFMDPVLIGGYIKDDEGNSRWSTDHVAENLKYVAENQTVGIRPGKKLFTWVIEKYYWWGDFMGPDGVLPEVNEHAEVFQDGIWHNDFINNQSPPDMYKSCSNFNYDETKVDLMRYYTPGPVKMYLDYMPSGEYYQPPVNYIHAHGPVFDVKWEDTTHTCTQYIDVVHTCSQYQDIVHTCYRWVEVEKSYDYPVYEQTGTKLIKWGGHWEGWNWVWHYKEVPVYEWVSHTKTYTANELKKFENEVHCGLIGWPHKGWVDVPNTIHCGKIVYPHKAWVDLPNTVHCGKIGKPHQTKYFKVWYGLISLYY